MVTSKRKQSSIPNSIKKVQIPQTKKKKKKGTLGCLFLRKIKFRSCQHPNGKHSRVLGSITVGSPPHAQRAPSLRGGPINKRRFLRSHKIHPTYFSWFFFKVIKKIYSFSPSSQLPPSPAKKMKFNICQHSSQNKTPVR